MLLLLEEWNEFISCTSLRGCDMTATRSSPQREQQPIRRVSSVFASVCLRCRDNKASYGKARRPFWCVQSATDPIAAQRDRLDRVNAQVLGLRHAVCTKPQGGASEKCIIYGQATLKAPRVGIDQCMKCEGASLENYCIIGPKSPKSHIATSHKEEIGTIRGPYRQAT